MSRPRNHYRYELRDHRKIVYFGITNDPERRKEEHANDGVPFTTMNVVGPAITKQAAERWEEDRLASYRRSHGGRNPRYNETDS